MNTSIQFMGSMVFLILFSVAIISFAIGFANDTGAEVSILDDENVDLGSYRASTLGDLDEYDDESADTYESILKSTVEPGSDVIQSSAPLTITYRNALGLAKSIILLPRNAIFGKDSEFNIFFTTFLAFLTFMLALLGYKALKGNP